MQAASSAHVLLSLSNTLCYRQRCALKHPSSTPTVSSHLPFPSPSRLLHTLLTCQKSTRTATYASRSCIPRKKTSTATSRPQNVGRLSKHPRLSCSPLYPCYQAQMTNHLQMLRLQHCGGRILQSSRSGYGSALGIAWNLNETGI